jgi:hypothetical protein
MNRNTFALTVFCCGLAACGGGGDGEGTSSGVSTTTTTNASIGGIWEGTNTVNGVTVQSLVLASPGGQFYSAGLNTSNNCADVATGTVTTSGDSFSGSAIAAVVSVATSSSVQTDCTFPDGSTSGTGTISGTVAPGVSLTVTDSFTTAKGETIPAATGTLSFNTLYNETSSLSKLAGNWTGPTGIVTTINSDGSFFAQDPSSGCVVNGQYSIINPSYNVYAGSATYSNCTGSAAILNGVTATGLATLNDQVSPSQLEGGASANLGNGLVIVVVATATQS